MKQSIFVALGILLTLIFWLLSGLFFKSADSAKALAESAREKPLMKVRVRQQRAELVVREIVIHGRTAPARKVVLRAETDGPIAVVGVERGSHVEAGSLIAEIAMRDRRVQLKQAQALLRQRELEYAAAQDLFRKGYQAETKLAEAETLLERARAEVEGIAIDNENTRILVPFRALLQDRYVEVGDYVQAGDRVAILLELDPLIITGEVTEREVAKLSPGQVGKAYLATGKIVKGEIRYIAPASDEESRTFTVELEVPNAGAHIPAGLTSEVIIPSETFYAHRLSPALLELDNQGVLGIKIVSDQDMVRFVPATIVKNNNEGVWLTGMPEVIRIITVGQGFVRDGEKVDVVMESTPEPQTITHNIPIPPEQ